MTVNVLVMVPSKTLDAPQAPQYTVNAPQATTVVAILDKVTLTNISTAAVEFSCNLVPATDEPDDGNLIIDQQRIEPGEVYECPELIGHAMSLGESLSTLVSASGALVLRVTGREITT
jgi:hypothetical protein